MSTLPSSAGLGRAVSSAGVLKVQNGILGPSQIGGGSLAGWWDQTRPSTVLSDGGAHFTAASSQYLSIAATATSLDFGTSNFSISVWVKRDSTGSQAIVSKGSGDNNYVLYFATDNTLSFLSQASATTLINVASTTALTSTTAWYNITLVVDRTTAANCKIYVNGVNDTSGTPTTSASTISNGAAFRVGTYGGTSLLLNGSMDSFGIWTRALSSTEITSLYNSGAGRVYADLATIGFDKTSLVSWWDLNEETGTRYDAHGTNHLTASNTVLISPSVLNGGFETAGAGGADVFGSWTETISGDTTISDETTVVYAGSHALKFNAGTSGGANVAQTVLRIGDRYSYGFYHRNDGSGGYVLMRSGGVAVSPLANATTSYALVSGSFTAAGTDAYFQASGAASTAIYLDNITVTDLGPSGIAGIAAGLATDGNLAGQFNGTNQYMSRASNATLQTGDIDLFISVWVMRDNTNTHSYIAKGTWGNNTEYTIYSVGASTYLLMGNGSSNGYVDGGSIGVGVWTHIFAWHDSAANTLNIKINNGSTVSAAWTLGSIVGTADLRIGASGEATVSQWMAGRIDSVILGKPSTSITTLASTISTALFNGGEGIKPSALTSAQKTSWGVVAGWDLDKKAGITVDAVGSNTLTNNGTVTYGQGVDYYEGVVSKLLSISPVGLNATQTTNSKRPAYVTNFQNSKAMMLFDGVDDFLSFTEVNLGTANSAFAVVRPTTVGAVGNVAIGGTSSYMFDVETNLYYGFVGNNVSVTSGMSADTTYIIGVVRNGTSVQFYKNGTTLGAAQTLATNTAMAVKNLGSYNDGSGSYKGYMADPLIYNTALSASQVASVFRYLNGIFRVY